MIEMISINSFHESKNNFRLIKRKSSNRKNMKTMSFIGENIAKIFGKLIYFEIEFFVRVVRNQNQGYVLPRILVSCKCIP